MEDFMKPIREELTNFENCLRNDIEEFNLKLNLTRKNFLDFIERQIEYLIKIQNEYNDQFNYLEEENNKTNVDNQQEFDRLCLSINKNDYHPKIVFRLLEDFKQKFPLRPKLLKSIPEYHFKDIQIDDFILKQHSSKSSPTDDCSFSSNDVSHLVDDTPLLPRPTTSKTLSHHKQFASQINENGIEPPSRLTSTYRTQTEDNNMVDIQLRIRYEHNWKPHLICFNENENYLLIYSCSSRQFKYLSLNSLQIISIDYCCDQSILNVGYCSTYNLFYLVTRESNRFVLFRLNKEEKQIEIDREIELIIDEKDHFINVHIYENFIFYLYLTKSSLIKLAKYDLESSSICQSVRLDNRLYENGEKRYFKILDFTIINSFICFLIQFKDKNQSKIIIHDYDTMNRLHSFDLIDSVKPISIVSTEKRSTTMDNNIELLLYINDPDGRLIHCCTYQKYLMSTRLTNFGICSLDDGNLVLIEKKDIRILNFQDYLKKNKQNFH